MITILFITAICALLIYLNDRKLRKVERQLREYADTVIKQRQKLENRTHIVRFGIALPDWENRYRPHYNVTSVYINSFDGNIIINFEYGTMVKRHTMTMEHAEYIGFINWDTLAEIAEVTFNPQKS